MILFDGYAYAQAKETQLALRVSPNSEAAIAAIVFNEDEGSLIYTKYKQEAAQRVGIGYRATYFSVNDPIEQIIDKITQLNLDPTITGIIIQKPWRKTWLEARARFNSQHQTEDSGAAGQFSHSALTTKDFNHWWQQLVNAVREDKDVDGLHPNILQAIESGQWQEQGRVLPATCKAVIDILTLARQQLREIDQPMPEQPKYIVIGKSDLLGQPLTAYLRQQGQQVSLIGRQELESRIKSGEALLDADVVVSATGVQHLVRGEMLKAGVVVIDVGEPRPDIEAASVAGRAAFLTPVPGGVGPVTVVSLLENCLVLAKQA
jgi:methylenetetrahydrofolate dehydrogenase (NADP+) / methenyltetrahydrofolate cyclohydrolase